MILGFDISTSIIGYCLVTNSGEYLDIGHVDLRSFKSFYDRLDVFNNLLDELIDDLVDDVYVETPLMMFKSNASMAQTISLLQAFNGACRYLIYKKTNKEPIMLNVLTARKLVGIKVPRKVNTKKYVFEHLRKLNIIPESKWEFKKTGNPKDYCYDQADAWVIAVGGVKQNETV